MSSEWIESSIGDICRNVFSGGTPKSTVPEYFDGGIPWLKTKEVNYCKITTTENSITDAGLKNSSAKLVPVNSVIVAMYGNGDTAGRVAINKIELTTNQACCNLVVDGNRADYRFVYYYLKSQYAKLVDLKNGGAQQNLNAKLIKDYPIIVPPLIEQAAIGGFLEALDDRIALLRETNATLEAIAQALFKSWFVDFDPVRAKQQGRPPESLDPATAALFPDDFEDTELGPVPKGWRVGVLGDFCRITIGGLWGADDQAETDLIKAISLRGVDLEHLRSNGYSKEAPIRWVKQSALEKRQLSETEVLIAASGAGPCGRTLWAGAPLESIYGLPVIYSNFVKRLDCGSKPHAIYIDRLLAEMRLSSEIWNFINGTSVPNLDDKLLLTTKKIVVPPNEVLSAFASIVEAIYANLYEQKAQTLATLRDTLLPRLISGQLRLPEAQSFVEEVTA